MSDPRVAAAAAKSLQSCPTVRPQRQQPTRLLHPWDSPGKNTGVGCHSLLQGIFPTQGSNLRLMSPALAGRFFTTSATQCLGPAATAKSLQSCPTVRPQRQQPTRLPCPWDSPGKNAGVGCHFLLQCMKVKSESESEVVSDS